MDKMKDIISLLDDPDTTVAVVGATDNAAKYGHKILLDLKRKGFKIYPVNPQRDTVMGDKAYAAVGDIPDPPTIVDFVIPPRITLHVLKQCLELGLKNVWIQPGAESPEVIEYVEEHGFNYVANACIMVESRLRV